MEPITTQTLLNIAQIWPYTHTLGPGLRSVVWVQGCPRHCPGCISPEWIPQIEAWQISAEELATQLLSNPNIEGLTFSGGEPMDQAKGLAVLAHTVRQQRNLNIICFTGYTYQQLLLQPSNSPVHSLMAEVDVLIDGPYVASLDDNRGLRGSSNQKVNYLTDRLREYDLETGPRRVEIHIRDGYSMMVGIPPWDVLNALDQSLKTKE